MLLTSPVRERFYDSARRIQPIVLRERESAFSLRKSVSAGALVGILLCTAFFMTTCSQRAQFAVNDPTPIQHIVFVIKENRTFDNYFGDFPGADGTISGLTSTGQRVDLTSASDCDESSLCNTWSCSLEAIDAGKMDKFDLTSGNLGAYGHMTEPDLPSYWAYARRFALADHFFSAVHGPSFPNHLFTVAPQSGGVMDNVIGASGGTNCDGTPSGTVSVMDQKGNVTQQSPCLDFQTVPDLLSAAGISWRYYGGSYGGILSTIRHIRNGPLWPNATADEPQFLIDAAAGNLAAVSWVLPPEGMSEHPPESACEGENWTTQVLNTLMQSPAWNSTVVFIAWDDSGGYYDHVPPPHKDQFGLGPRVPLLIISPFAKSGYVSHTVSEPSSLLKFVEKRYHLRALTARDGDASDMLDNFDFSQPPQPPLLLPSRSCPERSRVVPHPSTYTAFDND